MNETDETDAVAPPKTLSEVLAEQQGTALPTDDLLFAILPLLREVALLHARGQVAALGGGDVLEGLDGSLRLRAPEGRPPLDARGAIKRVQPAPTSALNVIDELRLTRDAETGVAVETLQAQHDRDQPIVKPVYLPGLDAWELRLGHHDEITDIFLLGQIFAGLACGLDWADPVDVDRFAQHRTNLFALNGRLHPVLAGVIGEMTALNRHDRATDLAALVRRLETYRDQPAGLEVDRVLATTTGEAPRRTAVLMHLRDRLFDLSRRNRLLYFRSTQSSVNLTVASVPMVLRLESIRPEQICTWGGAFAAEVTAGKAVSLRRWLPFEAQLYLPSALDRLIQEARRDRAEYGSSHLRLVVAFLRWNNLKEAPDERIVSPLLWLPVELTRKKGVTDQYILQCADGEAEFNPALRHHLRQLHDIRLPETIDLEQVSLQQVHADLAEQIRRTEPSVELRLQTRPAIRLIHQKAVQRLARFRRRADRAQRRGLGGGLGVARPDFSYDRDDYRPLGLAMFRQWVQPSPLPLRGAAGAASRPLPVRMVATSDAIESLTFSHVEDEGHRFAWDIDLTQVTLANFSYQKISLVRDYAQLIERPEANPAFDRVFSIDPREIDLVPPPPIPPAEQWNVVAADATQNAAVALARTGRSFIIQGPPGTGKSQTITNLIADYVGQGRRVLFVCEKRAALDVVFHRLKQSGLEDLCCLIHDSQADKKAFVQDLRGGYERWIGQGDQYDRLTAVRTEAQGVAAEQLSRIERFEAAMRQAPESLACSVRALVRRAIALPPADPAIGPKVRETLPDYAVWERHRDLTSRLVQVLQERFGLNSLARHPFARLAAALLTHPQAYAQTQARLEEYETLLDGLDEALENPDQLLAGDLSLADAAALTAAAARIEAFGLADKLDLLDHRSPAATSLRQETGALQSLAQQHAGALEASRHWRDKLTREDAMAALDLAQGLEHSLLRIFQPAWWRLKSELGRRYDFSQHAVRPKLRAVLEMLVAEHRAEAEWTQARRTLGQRYGVRDVDGFLQAVADLTSEAGERAQMRRLMEHLREVPEAAEADGAAAPAVARLAAIAAESFHMPSGITLDALVEWLHDMREAMEDLPDLIPLLRATHQADPAYAALLREVALPPAALEALVAAESLARLLRQDPELARFDAQALATAAAKVAAAERAGRERNAALVRAAQHRKFLEHVRQSSLSVTQLDEAGRQFKKRYAAGRRELEHEFGKSMRYRSIRELAGGDSGLVINDLKPIWLMSPLSVSDTLPLESDLFDVVIFDEASQIPMEEAVPALSRSRQVVIVGDEMQLPPTSFFSGSIDEEDAQVFAEEDGERIAIVLDADSLLNQAGRNLPASLLAWHYRSRHESLISFSNAAFYDGRLITIPDRLIESAGAEAADTEDTDTENSGASDQDEAAARRVDRLLAQPISFHAVEDGVYAARANVPEARTIATMVRELLRRETGMSLGVVAFSEAQQDEIETALEALAGEDEDFATRLEREYVREEEDQFNGLFVKNLENVQGDERDIILLSICYAPGPDGRMLMNFGPINQRGGEKRLNVIFSRARHRMAVISTIRAEAITNTHNDGAAALRAFLQYAEANARGEADRSQSMLTALNPAAQQAFAVAPPRDLVRAAIADALRRRGHAVREHVGRSQFRCDLAIVDADGESFALAILLDGEEAGGDGHARERHVFRPTILRAFGWRVMDLPCMDWLRDPESVLTAIEARLKSDPDDDDLDERYDLEPVEAVVADAVPAPATGPAGEPATDMREFRFQQGASNKFWKIGAADCDVTVVFGRVGARGQTVLKTFDSPARAAREVSKQIDEKLRKGYLEVE